MDVPVDRLKLKENPRLISPPVVVGPLYGCAKGVQVVGYLPHATIEVQVDGTTIASGVAGGFPLPSGVFVPLPTPLSVGQRVRARQKALGVLSAWSAAGLVADFRTDYPAGPPRPEVNPAPVYECGSRTGVGNLLAGCDVWITAGAVEVGRVAGAKTQQGVDVTPDYVKNDAVVGHASLCGEEAPPSETQVAQLQPTPLPAPTFEPVYPGSEQIVLNGLADGARFTLSRNGTAVGTYATWGGRTFVAVSPPAAGVDVFTATQALCTGVGPSAPGTATVLPCSALPAPTVGPVQDGDSTVTVTSFAAGARIRVYLDGMKVGDGGGPVVALSTPVGEGGVVVVRQSVGQCDGKTAQQVTSKCVDPPIGVDPSALNLFPVGTTTYDGGKLTLSGNQYSVHGTVYYPADADGPATPFNTRLAALGPVPVVFMAHGNHDPASPSHLGYDYFQKQLARMGVVACSVFLNETNGWTGGVGNILDRADLIVAGIKQMQTLHSGGDPTFGGRLNFGRVGLMGHSRGGDAVVQTPPRITLPGVTVRAVLALAPTNFLGAASVKPNGHAFMTLLPAADGDVSANDGAVFYDTAVPSPLKAELYVFNANHNYFNRQWVNNDNGGSLPTMARADHERILSAYGCAFYRAFLLDHDTTSYLTNRALPAGVLAGNVHLAFALDSAVVVDGHDVGAWVPSNSMGQATSQTGGLNGVEVPFGQVGGAFNSSFYGQSIGMVVRPKRAGATFRSPLAKKVNVTGRQVWVRVGEVFTGAIPTSATGFQLGLEDAAGVVAWADSDDVGGVARPFDRSARDTLTKTMPLTLRFGVTCFKAADERAFDARQVVAVLVRLNRPGPVPLAFQDLHLTKS